MTVRAKMQEGRNRITPDETDWKILSDRVEQWENKEGVRVGDYIEFADGITHRFSHDHGQEWGIQTSPLGGSFYMGNVNGRTYLSYSGGLEPSIKHDQLELTDEIRLGAVWFFHHDYSTASNGVNAWIPCRVFKTSANSDHWKGGK